MYYFISFACLLVTSFCQDEYDTYLASGFFFDAGVSDTEQIARRLLISQELLTHADEIDEFNQNHNQDWFQTLREQDIHDMRQTPWENYFTLDDIEHWKVSKRVRREVRDIPYSEFIKVVNAMNIMKFTDQITGIQTYGNKFRNYDYLTCLHGQVAWSKTGNENHHGPAFVTWHRAFELMFEDSVRAIDGTIEAMPYWDYRRDYYEPLESIMWTDKYMGELMSNAENFYGITNGPFQLWPVINADDAGPNCSSIANIWGQLRHPVTQEAGPYITRMGSGMCGYIDENLGTLTKWTECLDIDVHGSYNNFSKCFDQEVHGQAHSFVGGTRPSSAMHLDQPIIYSGKSNANNSDCLTWTQTEEIVDSDGLIHSIYYSNPKYGCFDCDETKNGDRCSVVDKDNYECTVTGYNGVEYTVELNDEDDEWIFGDFTDAVVSTNEPVFIFHHINMDYYSYIWQMKNYEKRPYYDYPTSGYMGGVNLYDVPGLNHPLINVFPNMFDNGYGLTNADIFDATTLENMPYIYADMLEAIEGRLKQTTGTETESVSINEEEKEEEKDEDEVQLKWDNMKMKENKENEDNNMIMYDNNNNNNNNKIKPNNDDGSNFNVSFSMFILGILMVLLCLLYFYYKKHNNSNNNNNNSKSKKQYEKTSLISQSNTQYMRIENINDMA